MLIETVDEFLTDECTRYAAAISYYAIFSLPALALLATLLLGRVLDPGELESTVLGFVSGVTSERAADAVRPVLRGVETPGQGGPLSWLLAAGGLVFGATAAFVQVQAALNRAWYVQPIGGGIRTFLWKRLVSFLLLVGLALLLLLGLGASTLLLAAGESLVSRFVEPLGPGLLFALDLLLSLALLSVVFAAVLRLLPDAEVEWRDVALGAIATALVFWIGKIGIAFYLSHASPTRPFGAAGSLALVLLWVYFTANLLLLGAEWTQVWARRMGRGIRPSAGAVLTPRGRERESARPAEAAATPQPSSAEGNQR